MSRIEVSRYDRHFAAVEIEPVDAQGRQTLETAQVAMMRVGTEGEWYDIIGPATDFLSVCGDAPRAILDLYCRRR